jgi:hypothetical protein
MAISSEAELLLCCARTRLSATLSTRIAELLRSKLDWDFVVAQAIAHGVAPLVYFHLSNKVIPAAVRESLRAKSIAETRWNLFLASQLYNLMGLFAQHRIAAVPFKGVSLAAAVYGDLALREGGDLDILLCREHALQARQLLLDLGYMPEHRLTEKQTRAYLRYHYAFVLSHPRHGTVVELHWQVAPRYFCVDLDFAGILKRVEPIPLEESVVPGLCPEDLLVALCVHGSRHCWERLIWLTDVAELLASRPGADWTTVLRHAETIGARRMLLLGVHLAVEVLDAPVPDEVRRRIAREPGVAAALMEWMQFFQRPAIEQGLLARMPFHLRCRERFGDRVAYTFRLLTTPTVEDWRLVSLPEPLAFLYLFLRVPRLLRKYTWRHTS